MSLNRLKKELRSLGDKERAKILQKFFKTGKGEYGEGDIFLGVSSPKQKELVKKFKELSLEDLQILLNDKIHTFRSTALEILVLQYKKADGKTKKQIYKFYLKNTKQINNWDLVDCSAHKILGIHLFDKDKKSLYKLAKSKNLWDKRIAIISTFHFIRQNEFKDTLEISKILLKDSHDLIHKAVGWMLREIGKRDLKTEEKFLKKYYKEMPRTMLRYAIEKFEETKRQKYLKGLI